MAVGTAWLAFLALCVIANGLLSWPFARRYLDQPSEPYRTNVFAVGFVWSFRALRPAAYVFAVSLPLSLLAWVIMAAA